LVRSTTSLLPKQREPDTLTDSRHAERIEKLLLPRGDHVKLEALTKAARGRGDAVDGVATVKSVEFHGQHAAGVIFTNARVGLHTRIVSRDDEPSLDLLDPVRSWFADTDGHLVRHVARTWRIEWMRGGYDVPAADKRGVR
jgi:hypothetical protein